MFDELDEGLRWEELDTPRMAEHWIGVVKHVSMTTKEPNANVIVVPKDDEWWNIASPKDE